jgi:hypothetical protein
LKDRRQTMVTTVSGDNKRAASATFQSGAKFGGLKGPDVVPRPQTVARGPDYVGQASRRYRKLLPASYPLFSFEPIEGW